LKRKLVDFAWIRHFFLFTRRVLALFRGNPANSFNQPDFFFRSACFDPSSGQPRVNSGKQEGRGREKDQKIGEFSFRGILQPTTQAVAKGSPYLGTVPQLGTPRQDDRLLRRTIRDSLPGSTGAPPPRVNSFSGLEMCARGAHAKGVPSSSTVPS